MLSGDNSILQRATDAKTLTERASVVEQARTDVLGYQADNKGEDIDKKQLKTVLDKYFDEVPDLTDMKKDAILNTELHTLAKYGTHTITVSEIYNGNLKDATPQVTGNLNADEIAGLPSGIVEIAKDDVINTTIKNNDNIRAVITGEVPIPNGFYYVGGTKDEGVVISDSKADSGKGTSHSVAQTLQGNQFVWVPVLESIDFKTYKGYKEQSLDNDFSYCSEPCEDSKGYSNEEQEYNTMKTSVINNNGFYVARYEASQGFNGAESKQGKTVWNNISWGESVSSIGNTGAVYQAQQMYTGKPGYDITSSLIYGVEWDAIMNWIDSNYKTGTCNTSSSFVANSIGKGNYSGNMTVTVSDENYSIKNIYDLAGNATEWTMEAWHAFNRVARGGIFDYTGSERPASTRFYWATTDTRYECSFRVALYL